MLHRALNPKILSKIYNKACLIKLVLWLILYVSFQDKVSRTICPQAVSIVVTESIVRTLPKVTSWIWNDDNLIPFNTMARWLAEPWEVIRNWSVNWNHRHYEKNTTPVPRFLWFVQRFDMSDIEIIREKAEKYIQWDPVKDTREEVQSLLKDEKWDLLRPLVLDRLSFGTAGMVFACCFV